MRAGNALVAVLLVACGGKDTPTTTTAIGSGSGSGSNVRLDSNGNTEDIDTLPPGLPAPQGPRDQCAKFVTRVIHATWPELHRNGAKILQADVDTEVTACRTNDSYPRKKDIGCVMAAADDTAILTCIDQLPKVDPTATDTGVTPSDAGVPLPDGGSPLTPKR